LQTDGQRVTGIVGYDRTGRTIRESARIVVGADGLHSPVASVTGATEYNRRDPLSFVYYSYWRGIDIDGAEYYVRNGKATGGIPTNDGLTCVFTVGKHENFPAFRANLEQNYIGTLCIAPRWAERVLSGRREERFYGTADLPNLFRRPWGDGWALVGDAGYHRDPVTAQGIRDAFRDAELLAKAIDEGLSGGKALSESLAEYEEARNRAVIPMFELTCQFARLDPPAPPMVELFTALERERAAADQFCGVFAGTVPVEKFYDPANLRNIVDRARPSNARRQAA
jgi:flavin-dependent dehydrogenase